jgi:hypothetical protein
VITTFQKTAFQNNAFQIDVAVVVSGSQAYGGGGSGGGPWKYGRDYGGGKVPNLDELEVFRKLEKRKPGQSIREALLEEQPEPEEIAAKPVRSIVEYPEQKPDAEPLPPTNPEFKLVQERLDEMREYMKVLQARAEAKPPLLNTDEDDAEVLFILSGLL